jgi:aryl-alcohol dehydrogenase-like predicted oxidoreductase
MAGNTSRLRTLIGTPLRVGLGGEGILRTEGREQEAQAMLEAAYTSGIRYFDSAPAYAGSERYLGKFWMEKADRVTGTFQASKSAQRDAKGALADLAGTLRRIGRDHLDLWQIHDLRTRGDVRRIERDGGALQAFIDARNEGKVRGIGVTAHHDPAILLHAVTHWDVDSVLLPVNPVEAALGGFLDQVIPAARKRGIGVIGMKVLGAGKFLFSGSALSAESLVRFALAQDVDLVIVGCSTPEEAGFLSRLGRVEQPMGRDEQDRLIDAVRPHVDNLAYYRGVL